MSKTQTLDKQRRRQNKRDTRRKRSWDVLKTIRLILGLLIASVQLILRHVAELDTPIVNNDYGDTITSHHYYISVNPNVEPHDNDVGQAKQQYLLILEEQNHVGLKSLDRIKQQ